MRISAEKCCAVVIDYQEKLVPAMSENERLISRSRILLEGLKALDIPILVTEQYPKGLGATVAPIEELVAGSRHIEKGTFSCCDTPEFSELLEIVGRKNVIVCGMESHVCVLQTVIDLAEHKYQPVWVHDCTASRNESDRAAALIRAQQEGALVTSSEALLFELLRTSAAPAFRTISKLVK